MTTRRPNGTFLPGHSPGRPAGVRNKLNTEALNDLLAEWREGGRAAVKIFRMEDPGGFVRAVLGTLPKELTIDHVTSDLSDDDLDTLIANIKQRLLEQRQALPEPRIIEHEPE
jgi:hypothetical protein